MAFPPAWISQFCEPDADRYSLLETRLENANLAFEVIETPPYRHLHIYGHRSKIPVKGEKILVAHYDRFPLSAGANDNSASVCHALSYLENSRRSQNTLRVVFTDGEELRPGQALTDQGSFALAKKWLAGLHVVPVVLDMTGIGDTFVLGHLAQKLVEEIDRSGKKNPALTSMQRLRLQARKLLAGCGAGDYVEIDTPFSDDLGFLLAGIPAIQLSLLPRKQALVYGKTADLPLAWKSMHTPFDTVDALEFRTEVLMKSLFEKLETFPF